MNILIVCTGNYSRSAMAAAILRREAKKRGNNLVVRTAGTTNWGLGKEPAVLVQQIIQEIGGILPETGLCPHRVTDDEVCWANIILVMEHEHVAYFFRNYLKYKYKVMLISELTGRLESVDNPDHRDEVALRRAALQIERYIMEGYKFFKVSLFRLRGRR